MSLYNGIDIVAVATSGVYTETYGSSASANIANLFASFGLFEDAPEGVTPEILLLGQFGLGLNLILGAEEQA